MKVGLFKGKTKRTKIFALITLLSVAVIIALNLLFYYFGLQRGIYLDMTPEGLYTLSDEMTEECDKIFDDIDKADADKKIKVTFCSDPDYLMDSELSRLTYFMALKLQNRYPSLFEVETVNVFLNPTAVSKYKTTSLSVIDSDNVIVSYGDRYHISTFDFFWTEGSSGSSYYNGEYRIASIIKTVTAISKPVAYFVTDHGETYYDPENPESEMSQSVATLASLLLERGLDIKLLKLSEVERIPEDCALLIINNPRTDFTYDEDKLNSFSYVSDTEKLDRYLVMKQGAIAVAKDYETKLPVLENFLYEWGFDFSDTIVVDKDSSLADEGNTGTSIVSKYNTDKDSYAYQLYGEYADLTSSPLTVFKNTGSVSCSYQESLSSAEAGTAYASRTYASFLTTSNTAQRYVKDPVTGEITSYVDGAPARYDLAALSIRSEINSVENTYKYSYIFCVNSPDFFSSSLLGEDSFANYQILSAVIEKMSRVEEYASMDLGALSFNSAAGGGKFLIPTTMSDSPETIYSNRYVDDNVENPRIVIKENHAITGSAIAVYTVIIFLVPTAILVVGAVVCVKRRFL